MPPAPEHEPKHDRLSALDTLGVAANALLHAQDAAVRRGSRLQHLALFGLPAVTAAYLAFCLDKPERQLPSAWLLTDKLLTTETAQVSFYADKNVDLDFLFGDLAAGACGWDRVNYAFRRHQLEIPPAHVHDDLAMCVLELEHSPSGELAHLSQWHAFAPAQLCADGHPAHILRLSSDIERVMQHAGVRDLVYSAVHPTVIVYHALQHIMFIGESVLSATKVSDVLFGLGYIVRVIFALERESAERGVKGHFLSPELWYTCLSIHHADLVTLREKVDKVAWFALGRKLAVADSRLDPWSSSGSDRAFEESAVQYTYAVQMLAELFKVTADFVLSSSEEFQLSDVHHVPFLDDCTLPTTPELRPSPGPLKTSPLRHRLPLTTSTERARPAVASPTRNAYEPLPRGGERVRPNRSATLPMPAQEPVVHFRKRFEAVADLDAQGGPGLAAGVPPASGEHGLSGGEGVSARDV
ncbi:hypothetical protein JCM8208_004111 [Rhodotorula glutinis]